MIVTVVTMFKVPQLFCDNVQSAATVTFMGGPFEPGLSRPRALTPLPEILRWQMGIIGPTLDEDVPHIITRCRS